MNAALRSLKSSIMEMNTPEKAAGNGLERRRELGQFFTSQEVVVLIWDLLEIINGRRFSPGTRLIDPACGEGIFLRVAHERGRLPARSLFGADIDESLAPGWQNDPLLRAANIHLLNGLLDNPASEIREGSFHIVAGNPPFGGRGLRDLLRLLEETEPATHEEQDFFQAACLREQAAPAAPPLTRNERAELECLVRNLSQYACWRLETGEDDVADETKTESETSDLFVASALFDRRRPSKSDFQNAAQLIANWPANRPLDTSRSEIRDTIRRLASTAIEVMFTERFVRLAKPGGLIAIIVPESIVASDRLGALRTWLLGRMDLLASISLPQKIFTGVGANAKTSIIFARRHAHANGASTDDNRPIFMAAPRIDAPGFTNEIYLARVLADARREREVFWPQPK